MPSLRKIATSPYWLACITLPDGRRTNRSTKATGRRMAQRIANDWQSAAEKARRGVLIEQQTRRILNELLVHVGRTPEPDQTVAGFLEKWLAGKPSPATKARYKVIADHFLAHLQGGRMPVAAIGYEEVLRFMDARTEAGVAPKTLLLEVRILQSAFNLAMKLDIASSNPVERALAVRPIVAQSSSRDCFTPEQVSALLNTADGDWKTVVLLGYYTGARLTDCAGFSWANIDMARQVLEFVPAKTRRGEKKVVVPLHPELLAHLQQLAAGGAQSGPLCPALAGRPAGGKNGLSAQFKKLMAAAGVDAKTGEGMGVRSFSKLSFHSLRHGFNSALANSGVAQETRMALSGHSTVAVNTGYSHLEVALLRAAVEKLPGLAAKAVPSGIDETPDTQQAAA